MNILFNLPERPPTSSDLPALHEDEGQDELGETEWHSLVVGISVYALRAHLTGQTTRRVYKDLCLYYHPHDPDAYVSPDVMVCEPIDLAGWLPSYRIGTDGPAPLLVVEVLSRRSGQQRDLTDKPWIHATMGVSEYLLLDPTGDFMPEQLRLMQCQPDFRWVALLDRGQGVASRFGFRVRLEPSGLPRFFDGAGRPYRHPEEAEPAIRQTTRQRDEAIEQRDEERRLREAAERRATELAEQLAELRRRIQPPEANP